MNYAEIARQSRIKCLELVFKAQTSHIGSCFSVADIMAVLFEKIDLDKDKFVLSAGWKASMLYYHLWRKGRITLEELDSYCQKVRCKKCEGYEYGNFCGECEGGFVQSKFIGLAEPVVPEIMIAGGSMGMGLPGAVGLALAKKLKGEEGTVYCLMSDGELAIGTTWESALIAAHHELDNLVVILDDNKFCAMGKTEDIIRSYFPAKGWRNTIVDGHDYGAIEARLDGKFFNGEDGLSVIFADTIKGHPISFMSSNNLFHYKQLSPSEYQQAMVELEDEKQQRPVREGA